MIAVITAPKLPLFGIDINFPEKEAMMRGQWMLLTATILTIASPGLSEVIVDGYASDEGETSKNKLEAKARVDARTNAAAYIEGVEFTLADGGLKVRTRTQATVSGLTMVEKGPLGNGLYRVRMRIPDSVPLRDKELRDTLEPTLGSGISKSVNLAFSRQKAIIEAISEAISKAAEDWYRGRIPKEITGRYYNLRMTKEEIISDSDPFSYQVEIEVKVWFSDPRVTTVVGSSCWVRIKTLWRFFRK